MQNPSNNGMHVISNVDKTNLNKAKQTKKSRVVYELKEYGNIGIIIKRNFDSPS